MRVLRTYSGEPVGVSPRTIRFVIRPGADAHRLAFWFSIGESTTWAGVGGVKIGFLVFTTIKKPKNQVWLEWLVVGDSLEVCDVPESHTWAMGVADERDSRHAFPPVNLSSRTHLPVPGGRQ